MSNPQSKFARLSPRLIGAGVLVVALGFGLPQLAPGGAPAPDPTPAPTADHPPAPIPPPSAAGVGVSLLKLAIGLVVVCGSCVFLARRLGPPAPAAAGTMEVLASIPFGRCALHLVRAGERRLLIGTDAAGVKALVELPGSAAPPAESASFVPTAVPVPDPAPAAAPTRDEVLNLLLRLRGGPTPPA
jgi:flagellar biogenesis protein FliO